MKICRNNVDNFLVEQRLLRSLGKMSCHVPQVLGTQLEQPIDGVLYTITGSLGDRSLRDSCSHESAAGLGRALRSIHRIDTSHLDLPPPQDRQQWELSLIEKQQSLAVPYLPRPTALHPFFLRVRLMLSTNRHALIHGDQGLAQVIQMKNGEVGVVDWECACIGDPMRDVAVFPDDWSWLPDVLRGYGSLTNEEIARIVIWRLYCILTGFEDSDPCESTRRLRLIEECYESAIAGQTEAVMLSLGWPANVTLPSKTVN